MAAHSNGTQTTAVQVPLGHASLHGDLEGSASGRSDSCCSRTAAAAVATARAISLSLAHSSDRGLATLLVDLLTPQEEAIDDRTAQHRFDIPLLASRLVTIIDWLGRRDDTAPLPIGLFGASTGGGAALVAAADRPDRVAAVVSRGGRPTWPVPRCGGYERRRCSSSAGSTRR